MKEDLIALNEKRQQSKEAYIKMTCSEKITYNLNGINSELKKLDPLFVEFSEPDVAKIEKYITDNNIGSDCGWGRYFCLDCGLSEIGLNLKKEKK